MGGDDPVVAAVEVEGAVEQPFVRPGGTGRERAIVTAHGIDGGLPAAVVERPVGERKLRRLGSDGPLERETVERLVRVGEANVGAIEEQGGVRHRIRPRLRDGEIEDVHGFDVDPVVAHAVVAAAHRQQHGARRDGMPSDHERVLREIHAPDFVLEAKRRTVQKDIERPERRALPQARRNERDQVLARVRRRDQERASLDRDVSDERVLLDQRHANRVPDGQLRAIQQREEAPRAVVPLRFRAEHEDVFVANLDLVHAPEGFVGGRGEQQIPRLQRERPGAAPHREARLDAMQRVDVGAASEVVEVDPGREGSLGRAGLEQEVGIAEGQAGSAAPAVEPGRVALRDVAPGREPELRPRTAGDGLPRRPLQ